MNKKIISLILGIMCVLLSYGIAVQIKTVTKNGTTLSTNAKENELRDAVLKSKEKYDNLYQQLENAENKLEEERNKATQNNTELTQLESGKSIILYLPPNGTAGFASFCVSA